MYNYGHCGHQTLERALKGSDRPRAALDDYQEVLLAKARPRLSVITLMFILKDAN